MIGRFNGSSCGASAVPPVITFMSFISGKYLDTGSSRLNRPSSNNTSVPTLVMIFDIEYMRQIVSRSIGSFFSKSR